MVILLVLLLIVQSALLLGLIAAHVRMSRVLRTMQSEMYTMGRMAARIEGKDLEIRLRERIPQPK